MIRFAFLAFLLLPITVFAQGIRFDEDLTLFDALKKAETEGKLVFIDAHTSWCGPCKMMASKVFTDSAVGDYFNSSFINMKMDMEKGEGTWVAERYDVKLYPTLLFINAKEAVAHKAVGYHGKDNFLQLAKVANDPDANLLALETRYRNGERNPALLRDLTILKNNAFDLSTGQVADDYVKTQTDLSTPENMDFIMSYVDDPFSEGFRYLQKNRAAFEENFSSNRVKQKLDGIFENYLQRHPNLQLGEVQRLYGSVYPEQGERLASNYRLTYYHQRGDMENFAEAAVDHYTRYPCHDADELNEIAWLFVQNVNDPAMLERAVEWAEASIAIQEKNYNQDTLARLYLKLGKKKQAAAAANRSIELAKIVGEDTSQMEQLLKQINGK